MWQQGWAVEHSDRRLRRYAEKGVLRMRVYGRQTS